MPRKKSEAVSEGNGPVHQEQGFGFGQPAPVDVYRQIKLMMSRFGEQTNMLEKRLTRLEHGARQPRLAIEADGLANTKTHERTEGAATAVQAVHGDSFSACRVDPGPKVSTSFGVKAEPPALPCRDGVVVESGDAAPRSCLSSLEMRTTTAAGGLVPTGKTSTATETTSNEPLLRFYATEETNPTEKQLWTSVPSAYYDSSFWTLLPAPADLRAIETKPM